MNNKSEFWDLYQAINMINSISEHKIKRKVRNNLWIHFLRGSEKSELTLRSLVYKDRTNIYGFLKEMAIRDSEEHKMGNLYKSGRFAILDYEYG